MSNKVAEDTAPYSKSIVPAEERVVLHNVSWETYERLLKETGDDRRSRMAYDGGNLEIMSPHLKHENSGCLISQFICALCDEMKLKRKSVGQMTCKREDKKRGLEPDTSFYIQNEATMRGVNELDLRIHPAPDLIVEIDISRSSIKKLGIYEALKVPEVWKYDGEQLSIFVLRNEHYEEVKESTIFPRLQLIQVLPQYLAQANSVDEGTIVFEFRTWVKQQLEARK